MTDRLACIESRLAELERAVRELDARVASAERGGAGSSAGLVGRDAPAVLSPATQALVFESPDITGPLGLAGRTVMIFAGAYLLRALVDSGSLPSTVGVAAGLAYAMAWLAWAHHAARRHGPAGLLYGGAAVAIAYPLVWEATTRFQLLVPAASAAALALVTTIALGVAWRRRLHLLAWAATVAALGTAAMLVVQTGVVAPYAVYLTGLGIATLWLGYDLDWFGLRWPTALAADLAVLGVTSRVLSGQGLDLPITALGIQFLLLASYVATVAARTLVRERNVVPFEIAQMPAALAVGLGGAVAVARHTGSGGTALGIAALAIGAVCYAVAFAFIDRRQGRGRNFYFYTSLGLVLTLTGAAVLLPAGPLVITWSAIAVVSASCAWRFSRAALTLHSAAYLLAGAIVSGLLGAAELAFVGSADVPWPAMTASGWVVLVAALICVVIPRARGGADTMTLWRVPRVAVALLLVTALGGAVILFAVPRLAGPAGAGCDAGLLATIRTAIVAAAAIVLALCGRYERFVELRWLLYPVLIAGGLKLLVEDLPHSRAATLFLALALYGGALIVAPRLARSAAGQGTQTAPSRPPAQV
jgi:hypothetical protein